MLAVTGGCASRARFVFGVISDVHYADKDAEEAKNYRDGIVKLAHSIAYFNSEKLPDKKSYYGSVRKVGFVIQLGDIIDVSENSAKDLDAVVAMCNRLKVPMYHVLGNHEFVGLDRKTVQAKLDMKRPYYDFKRGKWRFVVLDTMDISVTGGWAEESRNYRSGRQLLEKLTEQEAANAIDWNGGIGQEQKEWLQNVLKDAVKKRQQVVVFGHHPIMPSGDMYNLWNSEEIVAILQSYNCVVAYINGHRHSNDYICANGIYYVTIQPMIEAPQEKVYAAVWVYDDRLEIQSTAKVPWLSLPFVNR